MATSTPPAVANNDVWPQDWSHGTGNLSYYHDLDSANFAQHEARLDCWMVALNADTDSWRVVVAQPSERRLPGEAEFWIKFEIEVPEHQIDKSQWRQCVRLQAPEKLFDLQGQIWSNYAAFQVELPSGWAKFFNSPRISDATANASQRRLSRRLSLTDDAKIRIGLGAKFLPQVTWTFDSKPEPIRRHRWGVKREFQIESSRVQESNYAMREFDCWLLSCGTARPTDGGQKQQQWTIVVNTYRAPDTFPRFLDLCQAGFAIPKQECELRGLHGNPMNSKGRSQRTLEESFSWFKCIRCKNPEITIDLQGKPFEDYATFAITLPAIFEEQNDFLESFQPLFDNRNSAASSGSQSVSFATHRVSLLRTTAKRVCFSRNASDTTMQVELAALTKAESADPCSQQGMAIQYLMNFKVTGLSVNLFQHFPHLKNPVDSKNLLPPLLKEAASNFDLDQRRLYNSLDAIPCGVLMVAGPSGVGKTYFAMTLMAMLIAPIPGGRRAKILVQSDTNTMADDLANYIHDHFVQLGLIDVKVVRLRNWNHERIGPFIESDEQPGYKAQTRQGLKGELRVDTMREFCFKRSRGQNGIANHIDTGGEDRKRSSFNDVADSMMRQFLPEIDVIVTTPIGAAKLADHAERRWLPDAVFLDDAGRVKEASTLVSLTQFPNARFWCFTGSDQQTRPFTQEKNPARKHLQTSTMARFAHCNPDQSLSTRYGVYGGLEHLPSELFFSGKLHRPLIRIVPAPDQHRIAMTTHNIRQYLKKCVTGARETEISRVLVHIEDAGAPRKMQGGTSSFNVEHQTWVTSRLQELLPHMDTDLSILIITPYAESARQYNYAIRALLAELDKTAEGHRRHRDTLLEARTLDSVQGHAADIVFIDLVIENISDFIDDEFRLCVGLNLARHMEIILMHRKMPLSMARKKKRSILSEVYHYCMTNNLVSLVPEVTVDEKLLRGSVPVFSHQPLAIRHGPVPSPGGTESRGNGDGAGRGRGRGGSHTGHQGARGRGGHALRGGFHAAQQDGHGWSSSGGRKDTTSRNRNSRQPSAPVSPPRSPESATWI